MEIVAFDEDDKADGSGKAKITWISKDLLNTDRAFNNSSKTIGSDTGYTAGGWENSDLRSYLNSTIKALIPSAVRSGIVPVTKVQSIYTNGALVKNGQTTTDELWVPSEHEMVSTSTTYESTGATYTKFSTSADRLKKKNGTGYIYHLRSAKSLSQTRQMEPNNSRGTAIAINNSAVTAIGIALGFCTD